MLCSVYNEALPIPYIGENCQPVFGFTAQQMRTMTMEEEYAVDVMTVSVVSNNPASTEWEKLQKLGFISIFTPH